MESGEGRHPLSFPLVLVNSFSLSMSSDSPDSDEVDVSAQAAPAAAAGGSALHTTSASVRTIIDSLTGLHGYKLSEAALQIADREANTGLTAKAKGASVASAIIKKSKVSVAAIVNIVDLTHLIHHACVLY